jgi:hypothetical protein
LLIATAVAVATMIGIGLYFSETNGLPDRYPREVLEMTYDASEHHRIGARDHFLKHGTFPSLGPSPDKADRSILLWGDSHALALLPLIETLANEHNVCVHIAAHPSTPPLLDVYTERIGKPFLHWGRDVLRFAQENSITEVIIHARWRIYTEGPPDGDMRSLVSNHEIHSRRPEQAETVFRDALEKTIETLVEGNFTIALIDDVPFQPKSVPETVLLAASRGIDPNTLGPPLASQQELTQNIDALIESVLEGTPVVHLDPDPFLLNPEKDRFSLLRDQKILYTDQHHLSPNGTKQLRSLLEPLFEAPQPPAQ